MTTARFKRGTAVWIGFIAAIVILESAFVLRVHQATETREAGTSHQFFERQPGNELLKVSPLNDKTLYYNHSVNRLWLNSSTRQKPKSMILLTDFAWNHVNQTMGLEIFRGVRTRELYQGIINHPLFHPTGWQDLNSGKLQLNNATSYLVFLDRETAGEKSYPYYGRGVIFNADRTGGRGTCCGFQTLLVDEVMATPVMSAPLAQFMLMDSFGWGPRPRFEEARQAYPGRKLVFLSLSARKDQLIPNQDLGLPPPAVRPCRLTEKMKQDIRSCKAEEKRPVLLSLLAAIRGNARYALSKMNNGQDIRISRDIEEMSKGLSIEDDDGTNANPYHVLAMSSQFGAAPRGDNLFSYRFPEVASCGAIPVIYADDWQLPFEFDVVDWQEAVVLIPERDAEFSEEILEAVSPERRCKMRRKALQFYEDHLETADNVISTMIESLEQLTERNLDTWTGPAPSDESAPEESLGGNPCGDDSAISLDSPLNDQTLCYRNNVDRAWLDTTRTNAPPAMLLLSQFGWNNPITSKQFPPMSWYRGLRSRELIQGVVNHPWFHPMSLQDLVEGNMTATNVTYIVVPDFETCAEESYPHFKQGLVANADTFGGRSSDYRNVRTQKALKQLFRDMMKLNAKNIDWKVINFDCSRTGPYAQRNSNDDQHLSLASVSAARHQVEPNVDQGLPFPSFRKYQLSDAERELITSCKAESSRPFLLSFCGHLYSRPRKLLKELLHNGKNVMIGTPNGLKVLLNVSDPYLVTASQSQFAAVPRGTHIGSPRLMEVISAGAIPILFRSDNWLLPLNLHVNWTDIAVIVKDYDDIYGLLGILSSISPQERCRMRQRGLEVYENELSTGDGIIDGLVQGLVSNQQH